MALFCCVRLIGNGADQPPTKPPVQYPSKSVPIFNGIDLDGFRSWLVDSGHADPRKVFSVTEGCIRISGDGLGYLGTVEEYSNYILKLEFRWGTTNTGWGERIGRARDSGVFLHATGPEGNSADGRGAFMAAIECNVFQGAVGDFLLIRGTNHLGRLIPPRLTVETRPGKDAEGWVTWQPGGSPTTLERWGRVNWKDKDPDWKDRWNFRGAADVERPPGEWNQLECRCLGESVEIRLNGILVNAASRVWPNRGRILLQCEGSEIYYRGLQLEKR